VKLLCAIEPSIGFGLPMRLAEMSDIGNNTDTSFGSREVDRTPPNYCRCELQVGR